MKTYLLSFLMITFLSFSGLAQYEVEVFQSKEEVNDVERVGLATVLHLKRKTVEKAWEDRLDEYGNTNSSGNVYTVDGAEIDAISDKPCRVISKVSKTKNGIKVWWSIDLGSKYVREGTDGYEGAKNILKDFGHDMYRRELQKKIEEAVEAKEDAQDDLEDVEDDGEDLKDDLSDLKDDMEDLKEELNENKEEQEEVNEKLEENKEKQEKAREKVNKRQERLEELKEIKEAIPDN